MNLPRCTLQLESPLIDWREWISKLTNSELAFAHEQTGRYALKCGACELPNLTRIRFAMADAMVRRFPDLAKMEEEASPFLPDTNPQQASA